METSLPGTILGESPGALDVAKYRIPQVVELAKQQVAVQQKQAAEKQAAVKAATGKDIVPVFDPDQPEYAALVEAQRTKEANALKAMDTNPGNPNFDVSNPASPISQDLKRGWEAINQYQYSSNAKGKQWAEFVSKFNPATDSIDDWNEMKAYTHASPLQHFKGEVKQPVILGVFDENKYHTDLAKGLGLDTEQAYAYTDSEGIRHEGVTNVLSEDRLGAAAMSAADNPQDRYSIAINRQIAKMEEADRKALEKLASDEGISPAAYLARDKAKQYARKEKTASIEGSRADAYGSGYKTREMEAKRPVDFMQGLATGDLAVFNAVEKTPPSLFGSATGRLPKIYTSGALQDYVSDQEKVIIGDKSYDVNYRIEEIQVEPNGDYTFIQKPDLVEYKATGEKLKISEKAPAKRVTVSAEKAPTYLWRKFPQFNENVKESSMTQYLESIGGTYSKTGEVRFKTEGDGKPTANKIAEKYRKPETKTGRYE